MRTWACAGPGTSCWRSTRCEDRKAGERLLALQPMRQPLLESGRLLLDQFPAHAVLNYHETVKPRRGAEFSRPLLKAPVDLEPAQGGEAEKSRGVIEEVS